MIAESWARGQIPWERIKSNGRGFVFLDLEPGKYMFSTYVQRGAWHYSPGDFRSMAREEEAVDLPHGEELERKVFKLMRMLTPLDPLLEKPLHDLPSKLWSDFPEDASPVEFAWEPLLDGAEYRISVEKQKPGVYLCPPETKKWTTTETRIGVELPPLTPPWIYRFKVEAFKGGVKLGESHYRGAPRNMYEFRVSR